MAATRSIHLQTDVPGPRSRAILERKDRVVVESNSGDALGMRLLSGDACSGANRLSFTSDFALPKLPEIVVQEALNHFPERLAEASGVARRAMGKLRHLLPSLPELHLPEIDQTQAAADYQEALASRLRSLRADQPAYDGVSVRALITRASS